MWFNNNNNNNIENQLKKCKNQLIPFNHSVWLRGQTKLSKQVAGLLCIKQQEKQIPIGLPRVDDLVNEAPLQPQHACLMDFIKVLIK